MASTNSEDKEYEDSKKMFYNRMVDDGKLVSPIDLALESTQKLIVDKLKWFNCNVTPVRMKLTNTGETVIVSAKWATERPYLTGGPLKDSYVFSQIHFHWGSDEREGSEHTVRGICYPMELHAVFYKTRYLTQEAALKQEDGVIIVVYLIKLAQKTASGLHWLVSHLDQVVQPHSSTLLPLSPLSSLIIPFSSDYLVYWGSMQTTRCSHTMLWIVSRAALAITLDDLNAFRSLLNGRQEPMNRNFRGSNAAQGRMVFHINPSNETKNLLLPGTVEPPGQVMIVNYSQMPTLDATQAKQIFSKGDSVYQNGKKSETSESEEMKGASLICTSSELGGVMKSKSRSASPVSDNGNSIKTDFSNITKDNDAKRMTKALSLKQARINKKNQYAKTSIEAEKRREREIEKAEKVKQKERATISVNPKKELTLEKTENIKSQCKAAISKPIMKSKLPIPRTKPALQSTLAPLFQRPDSAPLEHIRQQTIVTTRPTTEMRRIPVATTIPRPLGRNAGKLDRDIEVKAEPQLRNQRPKFRPTSSPNKFLPKDSTID